jgi:hypothetical protein
VWVTDLIAKANFQPKQHASSTEQISSSLVSSRSSSSIPSDSDTTEYKSNSIPQSRKFLKKRMSTSSFSKLNVKTLDQGLKLPEIVKQSFS